MKFKISKIIEADSQEEMDGLLATATDENKLDLLGPQAFTCELIDANEPASAE